MSGPYLAWWAGGLALGGLALAQWLIDRRSLGVSGYLDRGLRALRRPDHAREEAQVLAADPETLRAALAAAVLEDVADCDGELPPRRRAVAAQVLEPSRRARPVGARTALLYVVAIIAGGAIAAAQRGAWSLELALPASTRAQFGAGGWLALLLGGALVGLGARMAGGCSSGHGLSGVARLQPASLVATATFLAAAIATTWVVGRFA
ncbi:MAG: YeeE/YedE family protein [Nannocystaceae bacterium]|nr:YeeE/YedE family protein [Nannocystaceae bacterium]